MPVDIERQRAWARTWQATGEALEATRRAELRALTPEKALRATDNLLSLGEGLPLPVGRRRTSGLVEQQRLLARLRGQKMEPAATVERFTRTERIEHAASALTFIALVITGLPQTRPDLAAAQWIIASMGGIWPTRLIHRTIGVIFVVLMVLKPF